MAVETTVNRSFVRSINTRQKLTKEGDWLYPLLLGFVLGCPSTTRSAIVLEKGGNGRKRKTKTDYKPVCARGCSFRERGITGHLLNTVLAEIRRPLAKKSAYARLTTGSSVEDEVAKLTREPAASDKLFEYIVYVTRSDMPDTEAIYYYIRNAFAHGSFKFTDIGDRRVLVLESSKDGKLKAQMRLRESTLLQMIKLSRKTATEIYGMQKKKA